MQELYSTLKNAFNLGDKHILILKVLKDEKLDAKEISKKTEIPYGRIYNYLNELLHFKLVEKTTKKPSLYFISNLNENVVSFMRGKIGEQLKAQSEIMHLLSTFGGGGHVGLIDNSEQFTDNHINMITESHVFHMMSVHDSFPYIIYPEKFEDFFKLRQMITKHRATITDADLDTTLLMYRTYLDALKKGKKLIVIFEKASFDMHMKLIKSKLGAKFLKKMLAGAIERLVKYQVDVYVTDEYTTMQMDLSETRVVLCLRYLGTVNGISIFDSNVTKFFNHVFEQKIKESQPVLPLLKKLYKEL